MNAGYEARTVGLDRLRSVARGGLIRAASAVAAEGIPGCDAEGQLIRPLLALAGTRKLDGTSTGFWDGVLAVQLAHEASLLHDDVIDAAATRRGEPTLAASRGVARALVRGDHLLTAAYRAAARTGSLEFVQLFARAVERTVAGEAAQGASAGEMLDRRRAEAISLEKSGELMGCALAVGATLENDPNAAQVFELGRRIGLFYQMLDDLLDYCPHTDTGKPALGDYIARRWTWVVAEHPSLPFGVEPSAAAAMLHRPDGASSPMLRALAELERRADALDHDAAALIPNHDILRPMLLGWLRLARSAVEAEARQSGPRLVVEAGRGMGPPVEMATGFGAELGKAAVAGLVVMAREDATVGSPAGLANGAKADMPAPGATDEDAESRIREELLRRIPAVGSLAGYLATNSRSFRFASRFFTAADAERVARVYAYCRITDDLVDCPPDGWDAEELLGEWLMLSRRAYEGRATYLPLLDLVMREMSEAGVPFSYAVELVEGMRMDLRGERYGSRSELRRYTFRVASVVGLWLTRLWGMTDPRVLDGAERLGHAMQLTNILRDVGEDLAAGRLYLPADVMRSHGLEEGDLLRMQESGSIDNRYRALLDELMEVAEGDYRAALAVLPDLPLRFARAIAASAYIYRGIHAEIRRNGYDNLTRRAYTTQITKARLAMSALWELLRGKATSPTHARAAAFVTHGTG